MKKILALAVLLAPLALPVQAQEFSTELGLGVAAGPTYPGADDAEVSPWLIGRNTRFGTSEAGDGQGFSISPSFGMVGSRDADDDAALTGLNEIDRTFELGGRVSYGVGPVMGYGALRKGFNGHEGLTGEVGAKYRTELSDRVTLWSGLELGYGDSDYNETYFGVTPDESVTSGYSQYAPGGGFNSAAITFEARYAINDTTAILGEVEYGKLIGDAADSPIVQEEYQPKLRVGVVRRFSFGF